MDVEARQLGLKYLNAAKAADTEADKLLVEARKASMAFGVKQDSAMAARRAVLAQQAYKHRINAVAGRQMAAYALLAADAGDKAVKASTVAKQVAESERQRVLITEAEQASARRNLMMQAMQATTGALKNVPGLPAKFTGRPVSSEQMTVNGSQTWRSPAYVERASFFFPSDIRAAAGSFNGVGMQGDDAWFYGVSAAMDESVKQAEAQTAEAAKSVVDSDPSGMGAEQQAQGIIAKLKAEWETNRKTMPPMMDAVKTHVSGSPTIHLVGLAAVVGLVYYFTRRTA
jgi:hypothetical protein